MNLKEFLIANGYEPKSHEKAQGRACECRHAIGLPSGEHIYQLEPSFSPIDGSHTVLVDNTTVTSYVINCPYNFSTWRVYSKAVYACQDGLKKVLESMLHPPKGCWGSND